MKKHKLFLSFGFLFVISCTCAFKETNGPDGMYLYRRDTGGVNGYITYIDLIAIKNYKNNSMKVKDFVQVAINYIDTVKADKPVSHVEFLGETPFSSLPNPDPKFDAEQRKHSLISFGFDNAFKENTDKKPTVISIYLKINDDWKSYYKSSKKGYQIDSLLADEHFYHSPFPD